MRVANNTVNLSCGADRASTTKLIHRLRPSRITFVIVTHMCFLPETLGKKSLVQTLSPVVVNLSLNLISALYLTVRSLGRGASPFPEKPLDPEIVSHSPEKLPRRVIFLFLAGNERLWRAELSSRR